MPGWKRDVGRRLDALIVRTSPAWHGGQMELALLRRRGQDWFLNFHCFTTYVKVAFFRGTPLRPIPAGGSKYKEVRYLDIREDDQFDEAQMATSIPSKTSARFVRWRTSALAVVRSLLHCSVKSRYASKRGDQRSTSTCPRRA